MGANHFRIVKELAGTQGFEPQLTESKSVVLPLHYVPVSHYLIHYTTYWIFVNLKDQIQLCLKNQQYEDRENHDNHDLTFYPLILYNFLIRDV